MKTKSLIKENSRQLFNKHGLMNVTLREVAKQMNKSYGNITYHFPNKEVLIQELFNDLNQELSALQHPPEEMNLLSYFLYLPEASYDITLKYIFFSLDFIEIKRNFPAFSAQLNEITNIRKQKWMGLLKLLLDKGYLKAGLSENELDYIMFLSGSVRTSYFYTTEKKHYNKNQFTQIVNLMLKPYLSSKGLEIYNNALSE